MRLLLVLVLPFIAALTVTGTYLNKELIVCAAWFALAAIGFLFVRPVAGIIVMTAMYLLAAYPTLLQALGFLTINNLIGVGFLVLLAGHILDQRDFSALRTRQVQLLIAIGLLFLLSSYHADAIFPLLSVTYRRGGATVDRTADLAQDFVTRLAFLVFFWVFVRSDRDIRAVFVAFMLTLFVAVPSALLNWMQGTLQSGFRAGASVTAGANPNRLAMICLIEAACWWFWSRSHPGVLRRLFGFGAIGASILVLMATGSRSGFLGCGVLAVGLQLGPRHYRMKSWQIGSLVAVGALAVAFIIPEASWNRMLNFLPGRGEHGAHSSMQRVETIETAMQIIKDHPVLGIGLGNFREVAKQVYRDPFYRPPHNSALWAAAEGGVFVLGLYVLLLWVTWRDLQRCADLADRDPRTAYVIHALRCVLVVFTFFSLFADIWLNPILYLQFGLAMTLRRHYEQLAAPVEAVVVSTPRRPLVPVRVG